MSSAQRWADIDLDAIRHNAGRVLGTVPAGTRLLAVVKAGGYGHGARPVAGAALAAGAWGLAVSTLPEAMEVLDLCSPERILLLGGLTPAEMGEAAAAGCAVTCYSQAQLAALDAAGGQAIPVHLKVDTGMGRLGCAPEQAAPLARFITASPSLRLAGTYTHLAAADTDPAGTGRQLALFREVLSGLGVDPGIVHAANSSAVWNHPESHFDAVRVGISLYGYQGPGLRPALALRALVTHVKTVPAGSRIGYGGTWRTSSAATIATVAAGYADGVLRARSNRGEVLLGGRRSRLVGRVSMDSVTVKAAAGTAAGDAVTFVGSDGEESITAAEVAGWSGTIPNEVLTAIGPRVERRYTQE